MKRVNICFIRHGQTDQNSKGNVQGRKDFPLNEEGRKQAHQVASYLISNNYHFDVIYSSPLSRAYETAKIIQQDMNLDLDIHKEFCFIERDFGEYEGIKVSREAFIPILNDIGEGLEKSYEIQERVYDGLINIIKDNKYTNILIVAHSHTIKALLTKLDPNYSFYSPMCNCAVNNFIYENNNITIKEYNIDPNKK